MDVYDSTLVTQIWKGEVGGGILAHKPKKVGLKSGIPYGFIFVVHDLETSNAFKQSRVFAVSDGHSEYYDDLQIGNYCYLYSVRARVISGPYQASTKLGTNLVKATRIFHFLPRQVRVEMIEGKPHGEMPIKNAITYMNQGAKQAHETQVQKIRKGVLGDGAHEKLHDMLVALGKETFESSELERNMNERKTRERREAGAKARKEREKMKELNREDYNENQKKKHDEALKKEVSAANLHTLPWQFLRRSLD